MKKVLELNDKGFVWHIDADFIAKHRANHYAKGEPDHVFQEEYNHAMSDDFELYDWYGNNMDWEDVPEENKRMVENPSVPSKPSYNASSNVVEIDD